MIPQIPGSIKRSTPIHGVVDSVFKAKKYEIPLLAFHPIVGGGFALAYVVSGRFNPARNAMMFSPDGELDQPLSNEQRKTRTPRACKTCCAAESPAPRNQGRAEWREVQAKATFAPDTAGQPALLITLDDHSAEATGQPAAASSFIGLARDNILKSTAPATLTRELLAASPPPGTS